MFNSHDPHRPFFGNDKQHWYESNNLPPAVAPSRTFTAEEITVPGFLADIPEVRHEIAEYYSSVRRCDDTVGAVLDLLREKEMEDSTIVMFLSDNGMAFPFSKTNCYLNSTKTPFIARWPGTIQPGRFDDEHFVSGIDVMPTLLDAARIEHPPNMDGRSFLPLLQGRDQGGRDFVFTQFHQTAAKRNYPMRCVQNRRFGYIFNPWSDGERIFRNESQAGRTMKAMRKEARNDRQVADRVSLFLNRVPEELYDFSRDPDALENLADNPDYAPELQAMRNELESWMEKTADPALTAFRNRESRNCLDEFMAQTASELGGT